MINRKPSQMRGRAVQKHLNFAKHFVSKGVRFTDDFIGTMGVLRVRGQVSVGFPIYLSASTLAFEW